MGYDLIGIYQNTMYHHFSYAKTLWDFLTLPSYPFNIQGNYLNTCININFLTVQDV